MATPLAERLTAVNAQYTRKLRFARTLPTLHFTRNELICQARAERRAELLRLGIRAR